VSGPMAERLYTMPAFPAAATRRDGARPGAALLGTIVDQPRGS
jgi:hypothetical protein